MHIKEPLDTIETVVIHSQFIKLDAFLKFAAACGTGGEAKSAVQNGFVQVNNAICTQRGKKLVDGDTILIGNFCYRVKTIEGEQQ